MGEGDGACVRWEKCVGRGEWEERVMGGLGDEVGVNKVHLGR